VADGYPPFSGDDDTRFDLQWGHAAIDAPGPGHWATAVLGRPWPCSTPGFDLDHLRSRTEHRLRVAAPTSSPGRPSATPVPTRSATGATWPAPSLAADNAFGTIGVAPEATLMLVKVLGDDGTGSFADVISGIIHAAVNDADVINMSLEPRSRRTAS